MLVTEPLDQLTNFSYVSYADIVYTELQLYVAI